jgi:predicted DNA-binding protein (MmcQ/YjbR family)
MRANYVAIEPGYHMSKKHWNTIHLDSGELDLKLIYALIDQSYNLVVEKLPKKVKEELAILN